MPKRIAVASMGIGVVGFLATVGSVPASLYRDLLFAIFALFTVIGISGFLVRPKVATAWVSRLNELFRDQALIRGQYKECPTIEIKGPAEFTSQQQAFAQRKRGGLEINDPHAILVREPHWTDDPVRFDVRTLDFAGVCALRSLSSDKHPAVVSASAVIVCPETRELVLHRRSQKSHTYPDCLHTLGGAYWPPGVGTTARDRKDLMLTAVREISEESYADVRMDQDPPKIIMNEIPTGFVQLTFLGFTIPVNVRNRLKANWEGDIVFVSFDQLANALTGAEHWVPTGKAAIMAWLALGAPNAGRWPRFGGLDPITLFD